MTVVRHEWGNYTGPLEEGYHCCLCCPKHRFAYVVTNHLIRFDGGVDLLD